METLESVDIGGCFDKAARAADGAVILPVFLRADTHIRHFGHRGFVHESHSCIWPVIHFRLAALERKPGVHIDGDAHVLHKYRVLVYDGPEIKLEIPERILLRVERYFVEQHNARAFAALYGFRELYAEQRRVRSQGFCVIDGAGIPVSGIVIRASAWRVLAIVIGLRIWLSIVIFLHRLVNDGLPRDFKIKVAYRVVKRVLNIDLRPHYRVAFAVKRNRIVMVGVDVAIALRRRGRLHLGNGEKHRNHYQENEFFHAQICAFG